MLTMSPVALLLWSLLCPTYALHLAVNVHYPEKGSGVEFCGFSFIVEAASAIDPSTVIASAPAEHQRGDLYVAYLTLPDNQLFAEAIVAVMANPAGPEIIWDNLCLEVCPKISPQGFLGNSGPYTKVQPLYQANIVDVWPDFGCKRWSSFEVSFFSSAIGRQVDTRIRLPAAQQENALARPSQSLPPIMFRLNAEWYWNHPSEEYEAWHSLMVGGEMEPVVIAEVYIKGVTWQSWNNQPIYTTEPLRSTCGSCDVDLQFICDKWAASLHLVYGGGNHSFGHASGFFEELWKGVVPHVLEKLPSRTDNKAVRTGMWGYCIGGLAAWNAITLHPDLYNIAYLGSPALDFDCGDAFKAVRNISLDRFGASPKIYIDSGADEGNQMNWQSMLLFRKLQDQGLVQGRDLFYSRAPFGTHQSNMFLRRALTALLVMFGSGNLEIAAYRPGVQLVADNPLPDAARPPQWTLVGASVVASFAVIFWIARVGFKTRAVRFPDAREALTGA